MKKTKNLLMMFLAVAAFFIGGIKVEARTVDWAELVNRLKEDSRVVEYVGNEQTNGEDISLTIESDDTTFKATVTNEGVQTVFELKYSDGVVTFVDTTTGNGDEIVAWNAMFFNNLWVQDTVIYAGVLYYYSAEDVENFLASDDLTSKTLANDGIELVTAEYDYTDENLDFSIEYISSFKLDLVNGFGGLVETDDPDCVEPTKKDVVVPEIPKPTPTPTPVIPVEEEAENPSTGDIKIYQVIGGITLASIVATGCIAVLRKKENNV